MDETRDICPMLKQKDEVKCLTFNYHNGMTLVRQDSVGSLPCNI